MNNALILRLLRIDGGGEDDSVANQNRRSPLLQAWNLQGQELPRTPQAHLFHRETQRCRHNNERLNAGKSRCTVVLALHCIRGGSQFSRKNSLSFLTYGYLSSTRSHKKSNWIKNKWIAVSETRINNMVRSFFGGDQNWLFFISKESFFGGKNNGTNFIGLR